MTSHSIRYTLGLDIGIASVGWAVLRNGSDGEPYRIETLGVRIFDKAEVPKTGASLAVPRREARSSRRVVRRRRHRKERIKYLIEQEGIMTQAEMTQLFQNSSFEKSVYEIRVEALDHMLTREEAVRLLIHFAQRRGYKSNSKAEEAKDNENGVIKQAISQNKQVMKAHGYRTFGEMLLMDERFYYTQPDGSRIFIPHNKASDYKVTAERSMLADELHMIFAAQRSLGSLWFSDTFETAYMEVWSSQRSFDEGPGGDSPYSGNQVEKNWGKCTFEKDKLRAPKASYSAEYFRLLQDVNHLRIVSLDGASFPLNQEQRDIIVAAAKKSGSLTYTQIRKKLKLSDDQYFNALYYGDKTTAEVEKKKFGHLQFYHQLRTALDKAEKGAADTLTWEQRDEIARILTVYKADAQRADELRKANIPEEYIDALLPLSPTKPVHLSVTALKKIIPYLEAGMSYSDALSNAYGSQTNASTAPKKNKLSLNDIEEITNPVVRRAVSQSIKVINAIVRQYGAPERVRVELAREMGKNFKDRDKIAKSQTANAAENERIKTQISEYKSDHITGQDIVKFKLFKEQDGICLYSGKSLDIARLFEPGYVDVDHIIPYSISFDDSYNNKVLVLSSENRQKGNRIPYAYFGQDKIRWEKYETLVNNTVRSYRKRKNLLLKSLSEAQIDGFKQRNLQDTQYLSKVVFRLIEDHLEFAETAPGKKHTQPVNGAITAQVRKRLGIEKIREDGDLHHAVDAAVIACITPGMIQKMTKYAQNHERFYATAKGYVDIKTGEVLTRAQYEAMDDIRFPEPWAGFRLELEARVSEHPQEAIARLKLPHYENSEEIRPIFVSRMPNHKVTGAAHLETIRSKKGGSGSTVTKTALPDLKLDKNGEIAGYYRKEDDPLLYEALKARLKAFGGDGKKAFAEPFHKPKHNGEPGPIVKKVKIQESATLTVPVNHGIAANGSMVRLDVFHVDGDGYYFVPIYTSDTVKPELPNRAVVAGKRTQEWKVMDDSYFKFSLYPKDLIRIRSKKGIKLKAVNRNADLQEYSTNDCLCYFVKFNISTGALSVENHDRKFEQPGLGGKTLLSIEKYQVDVLGNYSPVALPEKRMKFR